MTQVDFYVVPDAGIDARLSVVARLADKAWNRGHRLYIHVGDEDQAQQLDELLWHFRPGSFIPHRLAGDGLDEQVLIGWGQEPEHHNDVLINLAAAIPPFFSRFNRVAEVVTQDPKHLDILRSNWRFYRDRGYQLAKHDLPAERSR